MGTAETQQALAFATMCVDLTAKPEGCRKHEMYELMNKVGLIHGLTTRLDALHTQSKDYVVAALQTALRRLETANN